jgi:hypothetical protein
MTARFITNNSTERAFTTNYFDGGRRYAYRINNGILQSRIDEKDWEGLPFPKLEPDEKVENVAADNNRVFIRTTSDRLYWRCVKEDSASWVTLIFTLAELISETEANALIWDKIQDHQKFIEGADYRSRNLNEWAEAYGDWVRITHAPGRPDDAGTQSHRVHWAAKCLMNNGWNSLSGRKGLTASEDDEKPEILDIAVGNWNNTVATYYLLVYSRQQKKVILYYLDEEAIMHSWLEVPGHEGLLTRDSRISASHSVVGAITGNHLHWIRIDAHQPGHIDIWPLNWTEAWNDELEHVEEMSLLVSDQPPPMHPRPGNIREQTMLLVPPWDVLNADNYPGWHTIEAPVKTICEFLIDVGFGHHPWPVPEPGLFPRLPFISATRFAGIIWKLYLLMATYSAVIDQMRGQEGGTEIGFLGENSIKPNSNYPVCCIIRSGDRNLAFAIPDARKSQEIVWQEVEAETSVGTRGSLYKRGMADICFRAYQFQNDCYSWTNENLQCTDVGYERCAEEEDQGYQECSRREDQGYRRCSERRWQCPDWVPGWACDAANNVARLVCVAWTWVSKWVCVAWTWVSNIVCVAWEWVSYIICIAVRTSVKAFCSVVAGGIKKISCWAISCWEK